MKVVMFISVLFCCTLAFGQQKLPRTDGEHVKVSDWGRLMFLLPPGYWDNKEQEITKQIGATEFEMVKKYSNRDYIPCAMQLFCEDKDGSGKKNLDTLKIK